MIYIYDGSFEGMCSAVFAAYGDSDALIFSSEQNDFPMLEKCFVSTDKAKSDRLQSGIEKKLSSSVLKDIYLIFLSDTSDSANVVLRYLRFCFAHGNGSRTMRYEPDVKNAITLREKVAKECHRMLGLVRFDKAKSGVYISRITPDHNILPRIAHHFADRMPSQSFIIHDVKRGLAMFSYNGSWIISELSPDFKFDISEDDFMIMWKEYWKAMGIKERKNPKLQRNNMPRRYWSHLTEMS